MQEKRIKCLKYQEKEENKILQIWKDEKSDAMNERKWNEFVCLCGNKKKIIIIWKAFISL